MIGIVVSLSISMVIKTTIKNIAKRAGVVPAMAGSDHEKSPVDTAI
jgi:hypothetical protein